MKKTLALLGAALLFIGCWGGSSCESCDCSSGCCDSGSCGTDGCSCACTE